MRGRRLSFFFEGSAPRNPPLIRRFAPPSPRKRGTTRSRLVVLEFADYATALACYRSPDYAEALTIRQAHSVGDVVIVEGYDGPQPG